MSTSSTSSTTSTGYQLTSLGNGSTLQITGLASGLDTDQIVAELMAVKEQPLTALQNEESGLTALNTALGTIQTALQTVANDASALLDPSLFNTTQQVTSSDPAVVSATTSTGAGVGGYEVQVTQLANSAQRTFTYTSPTSDDAVTIDGVSETITAGESLQDYVNQINSDPNATVYAAATDSNTVVLSDRATGYNANYIDVSDPSGTTLVQQSATAGQDAEYAVGANDYTSSSNTVTNGIPGVTLTLSGLTTTTGPVTVNVAPPAPSESNVQTAIQQFVTDYNSAISAIQTQLSTAPSSTDPTQGTLYGDTELTGLLSSMRTAMYQDLSGLASGMTNMTDIGVSTGATTGSGTVSSSALAGDLTLNTSTLSAALASNPSGVQQLLEGWANSFSSLVNSAAEPGGTIDLRVQGDSDQISDLGNQITDMQASLADQQTQLTNQFAALEAALSENQSESASLTQQLASLPGV